MRLRFFQLLVWLALALFAPEIAAVADSVVVDLVAVDPGSAGFALVDLYSGLAGLCFDPDFDSAADPGLDFSDIKCI